MYVKIMHISVYAFVEVGVGWYAVRISVGAYAEWLF